MAARKSTGIRWGRWAAGIAGLIVVLIAIALIAPSFVPKDRIAGILASTVHDATGRDLVIKGDLSVSVLPTLMVTANDVTFSNASWAGDKPMVSLAKLDVRLHVIPLLSGRIAFESFVLEKPVIDLQTDKTGRGNWEFGAASPAAPANAPAAKQAANAPAQAPAVVAQANGESQGGGFGGIGLGAVSITDGVIVYRNGMTGKTETAGGINLKVTLANMESPLKLEGAVKWHGKPVDLTIDAASPRDLMGHAGSQFAMKLGADPVKLAFAGTMALAGAPKGTGDLDLSVPSVRGLVQWATGTPLNAPGDGLQLLALKGKVTVDGAKYSLADVQLALDSLKGAGDFSVDTGAARPAIKGKLAVDKLDLNHYMAADEDKNGGAAKTAAATPSPVANKPASGGAPQAAAASSGWSEDPIDPAPLRTVDVNLNLTADSIVMKKIEIGKTVTQITLDNGHLTLDLTDMALYQGSVQGRVSLDGTGTALASDANLKIDKVQVGPLLKAASDTDRISGALNATTQLSSRGKSEKELVSALGGKGQLKLENGVIKGIDLAGAIKDTASSVVGGGNSGETSFASASGTYVITAGILKNNDFNLSASTVSATGAGTVDLPKRMVDYKLEARLAGTLAVPVNVKGPWDNISTNVDVAGMVTTNVGNAGKLVGSGVKGAGGLVGGAAGGAAGALGGLGKKLFGN